MPVPALADEPTGEIVRIDLEDAALVDRAAAGDTAAFESLYERHADAAWRVAAAVAANEHDAADAVAEAFTRVLETIRKGAAGIANFRAYLLTTTRNAALDRHRHHGRERPGDDVGIDEPADGPDAVLLDLADMSLAAAAFGDLPDRWREVLWLTEVEGLDATEVAERMGLNRNALAQLAFRARGGLRERFLHRHLGQAPRACRPVVELLAAYALHRLPERDRAKVDAHLTSCSDCRRRHDDLADMGTTLRRALIPMPASLAAATGRRFLDLVGTASPGRLRDALAASGPARVAVGACATALAVAGLLNLGGLRPSPALDVPPVSAPAETSAPPTEEAATVEGSTAADGTRGHTRAAAFGAHADRIRRAFAGDDPPAEPPPSMPPPTALPVPGHDEVSGGDDRTPGGDDPDGDPGEDPPTDPGPEPIVQVVVEGSAGEHEGLLAVGAGPASCTGARLDDQSVGCTEPEHETARVTIPPSTSSAAAAEKISLLPA